METERERRMLSNACSTACGGNFETTGSKMESYFSFIKDCLLKFNYPLAHSMTEEELGDIFQPSNRCFLISWILKLLDTAYEEVMENYESDKDFLGNMVHELGFCSTKEKVPFMSGDLPVGEQVRILFNMLTFLTDIKTSDNEKKNSVTNDELVSLKNTNLNLFPMYGDIRYMKTSERCHKLQEFKKEIEDIKAKISSENDTENASPTNYKFNDVIEEFFLRIKSDFSKIGAVINSLKKDRDIRDKDIIQLYSNSTELMRECSVNLQTISQFTKDIIVIRDFVEANTKINTLAEEITSETTEMIQTLYQELLSIRKYARCL